MSSHQFPLKCIKNCNRLSKEILIKAEKSAGSDELLSHDFDRNLVSEQEARFGDLDPRGLNDVPPFG
jgi:hypothetical protein